MRSNRNIHTFSNRMNETNKKRYFLFGGHESRLTPWVEIIERIFPSFFLLIEMKTVVLDLPPCMDRKTTERTRLPFLSTYNVTPPITLQQRVNR